MTALGALALAAGLLAQPTQGEGPLAEARRLIDAGRAEEARDRLQAAEPTPEVRELLGVAHFHADELAPAAELLEGVLDELPEDSVAHREAVQVLGLSLYQLGRLAEAIPHLEQTRRSAGDSDELNQILGRAYIQTRQPDRAREAWARTFGLEPDTASAHLLNAQMMIRLDFGEEAAGELRRAIDLDPRLPRAHYLLGQLAIFRARFDEGIELTRRELELSPTDAMAWYQLGDAFSRQRRWDEAIEALQRSLWLNPWYSGPYILLGQAYSRTGHTATAEGMLRQAISYDPNNPQAHYLLGQLLQKAGRTGEAAEHLALAQRLQDQRR